MLNLEAGNVNLAYDEILRLSEEESSIQKNAIAVRNRLSIGYLDAIRAQYNVDSHILEAGVDKKLDPWNGRNPVKAMIMLTTDHADHVIKIANYARGEISSAYMGLSLVERFMNDGQSLTEMNDLTYEEFASQYYKKEYDELDSKERTRGLDAWSAFRSAMTNPDVEKLRESEKGKRVSKFNFENGKGYLSETEKNLGRWSIDTSEYIGVDIGEALVDFANAENIILTMSGATVLGAAGKSFQLTRGATLLESGATPLMARIGTGLASGSRAVGARVGITEGTKLYSIAAHTGNIASKPFTLLDDLGNIGTGTKGLTGLGAKGTAFVAQTAGEELLIYPAVGLATEYATEAIASLAGASETTQQWLGSASNFLSQAFLGTGQAALVQQNSLKNSFRKTMGTDTMIDAMASSNSRLSKEQIRTAVKKTQVQLGSDGQVDVDAFRQSLSQHLGGTVNLPPVKAIERAPVVMDSPEPVPMTERGFKTKVKDSTSQQLANRPPELVAAQQTHTALDAQHTRTVQEANAATGASELGSQTPSEILGTPSNPTRKEVNAAHDKAVAELRKKPRDTPEQNVAYAQEKQRIDRSKEILRTESSRNAYNQQLDLSFKKNNRPTTYEFPGGKNTEISQIVREQRKIAPEKAQSFDELQTQRQQAQENLDVARKKYPEQAQTVEDITIMNQQATDNLNQPDPVHETGDGVFSFGSSKKQVDVDAVTSELDVPVKDVVSGQPLSSNPVELSQRQITSPSPKYKELSKSISARQDMKGSFDELLWTHNTPIESVDAIFGSGHISAAGDRGANFRYGLSSDYGEVKFVMKKDFEVGMKGKGDNLKGQRISESEPFVDFYEIGRTRYGADLSPVELKQRIAQDYTFKRHLARIQGPDGSTIAKTELHSSSNPQLQVADNVDLDMIDSVLVPEHVYNDVVQAARKNGFPESKIVKVETGSSNGYYMYHKDKGIGSKAEAQREGMMAYLSRSSPLAANRQPFEFEEAAYMDILAQRAHPPDVRDLPISKTKRKNAIEASVTYKSSTYTDGKMDFEFAEGNFHMDADGNWFKGDKRLSDDAVETLLSNPTVYTNVNRAIGYKANAARGTVTKLRNRMEQVHTDADDFIQTGTTANRRKVAQEMNNLGNRDAYELLGIQSGAIPRQIDDAFRKLQSQASKTNIELFSEIKSAHTLLKDQKYRTIYDNALDAGLSTKVRGYGADFNGIDNAATYRQRLSDAEVKRDTLQNMLESHQGRTFSTSFKDAIKKQVKQQRVSLGPIVTKKASTIFQKKLSRYIKTGTAAALLLGSSLFFMSSKSSSSEPVSVMPYSGLGLGKTENIGLGVSQGFIITSVPSSDIPNANEPVYVAIGKDESSANDAGGSSKGNSNSNSNDNGSGSSKNLVAVGVQSGELKDSSTYQHIISEYFKHLESPDTTISVISVDVDLDFSSTSHSGDIMAQVNANANSYFNNLGPGDDVSKEVLRQSICSISGVTACSLNSPSRDIDVGGNQIARLGSLS
jgi:hypothetical protein